MKTLINSLLTLTTGILLTTLSLSAQTTPPPAAWTSTSAQHLYGFPDSKPRKQGTLTLDATSLTFTSKATHSTITRDSIVSLSNGSDRVELWGTTGRLVRMAIPDGGGIAAAAIMHHRVGMLTVDFVDVHGGRHSAVFGMAPAEATAALATFGPAPTGAAIANASAPCTNATNPGSVLVAAPNWDNAEVPAAYRALVYEHIITRLQAAKGVTHVYRDGEVATDDICPAYTVHIAVQTFKLGNQVKRAALGPIGMFTNATKLAFDFNITDASGQLNQSQQIKSAVRNDAESIDVADKFAKSLTKHYTASLKAEAAAPPPVGAVPHNSFR